MEKRIDVSEVVEIPQEKETKNVKKIIIIVASIVVFLVIAVFSGIYIYMNSLGINYVDTNDYTESNTSVGELEEDTSDENFEDMEYIRDDSDTKAALYKWYTNGGDHMKSSNVINVLIVGVDASGGSAMTGNSDVMMLASIDKKEGKITLCSFLRDSYTYYETNSGKGVYTKLNAAYAYGGPSCLMRAIEYNYKITLDYFVAVDFKAFENVIDTIDGVNIDITRSEANEIQSMTGTYVPYGEDVRLNGKQALAFARIRRLYSTADVHRTENQRKIINAIIKKTTSLGVGELNNVVQALGPYIYTDCSSSKILSLGTNAILGKWYSFQVYSMTAPPESAREAYEGPPWLWIVDYPYSAQYVQKQIYGKTNIVID